MCQIHGLREEKMKVTFRLGENETEIDFVLTKKRTQAVFKKCEGNPLGVSTCISDSKYR